jgi:hypothetical protein
MSTDPILDGPPVFILIAIIFGLATYLRHVSLAAQSLIDEIERDANKIYPYNAAQLAPRTRAKMDHLRTTRSSIALLTQLLFGCIALLAVRVFAYAGSRIGWTAPPWLFEQTSRHWFDLWSAVALFVLVAVMWFLHTTARRKDERIRNIPLG